MSTHTVASHRRGKSDSQRAVEQVVDPFLEYLKQDAEPQVLARSATLGFLLGLCPVIGVSACLCLLACFFFRSYLHAPMALLFNFVAVPVEVLLIVPFMRFGELILRADKIDVIPDSKHFRDFFRPGKALLALGHASFGWIIICVVVYWPIAFALTPLFGFLRRRFAQLRRTDSDHGPLLDGLHSRDDRSTVSDVELTRGTPSPTSPLAQRGPKLSPRSSSAPAGMQKLSPLV